MTLLDVLVFTEKYWESFLDTKQRGSTHVTDNGYNQTRKRNMSTRPLTITMVDLPGVMEDTIIFYDIYALLLDLKDKGE